MRCSRAVLSVLVFVLAVSLPAVWFVPVAGGHDSLTMSTAEYLNMTYKLGPIFPTPAGYTVTMQYNASISDQDIQAGNMILNEYVPKLLQYFYSPAENIVVTVQSDRKLLFMNLGGGDLASVTAFAAACSFQSQRTS
jgi:hypothetical protein